MKFEVLYNFPLDAFKRLPLWQQISVLALPIIWAILLAPHLFSTPPKQASTAVGSTINQEINKHLQASTKKAELNQLRTEVQNSEFSTEIKPQEEQSAAILPQISAKDYGLFKTENLSQEIYKDLAGTERTVTNPLSPRDRIDAAIANQEWADNYEQHQRHEYVKEFVENARAKGYEVYLNDKLEVVEVRGIGTNKRYRGLSSIRKLGL